MFTIKFLDDPSEYFSISNNTIRSLKLNRILVTDTHVLTEFQILIYILYLFFNVQSSRCRPHISRHFVYYSRRKMINFGKFVDPLNRFNVYQTFSANSCNYFRKQSQ